MPLRWLSSLACSWPKRTRRAAWAAAATSVLLAALGASAAAAAYPPHVGPHMSFGVFEATVAKHTLMPGESLDPGASIFSPGGRYRLKLLHDGNLVLRNTADATVVWDSSTAGHSDATLMMQSDGNLVLYELPVTPYDALWHSGTDHWPGAHLAVTDDATVTVVHPDGRVLWTAGTSTPDVGLAGAQHIVYSVSDQRVWLVEADGTLFDTYLVSGRAGTPAAGRYRVFSKSVDAWSFEPGVTMKHMVRFARDNEGKAIGFHSIPRTRYGSALQTTDQLGQYRSAGCVRQRDDKARQLYEWAPIDTPVVVLA